MSGGVFDSHKNLKKAEVVFPHKLGVGDSHNVILKLSILINEELVIFIKVGEKKLKFLSSS